MPFELEWGIALAALAVLVAVVLLAPRKKKNLPTPRGGGDEDDGPAVEPLFYGVLRPLLKNPAVYAVCQVEDEFVFLRVSWYHPDMTFGTVPGRGFAVLLRDHTRSIVGLAGLTVVGSVAFFIAYFLGLKDVVGVVGGHLLFSGAVVVLLAGAAALVTPLTWAGRMAAEREFRRESAKIGKLRPSTLLRAADSRPNLRADRDELADAEVELPTDNDESGKVATLRFTHPTSGEWKFDLYSEEDADAARQMLGLAGRRRRRRSR